MQLTDEIIVLRPPIIGDVPQFLTAVQESIVELHPWMDWATETFNITSAQNWLEHSLLAWSHNNAFYFSIMDAKQTDFIGCCELDGIENTNGICNLGYWIRSNRTSRGFASRAIRLAVQFAFESLDLKKVEIVIAADNIGSQRAAEKAGARFDGPRHHPIFIRQEEHTALNYSFSATDFFRQTS